MGTDFFDDDLAREQRRALKIKLDDEGASIPRDGNIPSSRDIPNRPVADLSLTSLARHSQEERAAAEDKAQELERLRLRQEKLEQERRMLEELRRKQETFEAQQREWERRLQGSLARMEKEQAKAEQLAQLLGESRRLFRGRLDEVLALNDAEWDDEALPGELDRALALFDELGSEYNRALARLEAAQPEPVGDRSARAGGAGPGAAGGFGYWLRAGLAFTLPLMVLLALLALAWMGLYYGY